MISDPRINVWVGVQTESNLDRIAKQARDVEETADRIKRLAEQLRVKAQRGDKAAERALAVLVDGQYEAYAESLMECAQ